MERRRSFAHARTRQEKGRDSVLGYKQHASAARALQCSAPLEGNHVIKTLFELRTRQRHVWLGCGVDMNVVEKVVPWVNAIREPRAGQIPTPNFVCRFPEAPGHPSDLRQPIFSLTLLDTSGVAPQEMRKIGNLEQIDPFMLGRSVNNTLRTNDLVTPTKHKQETSAELTGARLICARIFLLEYLVEYSLKKIEDAVVQTGDERSDIRRRSVVGSRQSILAAGINDDSGLADAAIEQARVQFISECVEHSLPFLRVRECRRCQATERSAREQCRTASNQKGP